MNDHLKGLMGGAQAEDFRTFVNQNLCSENLAVRHHCSKTTQSTHTYHLQLIVQLENPTKRRRGSRTYGGTLAAPPRAYIIVGLSINARSNL